MKLKPILVAVAVAALSTGAYANEHGKAHGHAKAHGQHEQARAQCEKAHGKDAAAVEKCLNEKHAAAATQATPATPATPAEPAKN